MAHNLEPMDIDDIVSDFDNKENTFQLSNVLVRTPSTEKGYEELDVSELNMKLRYSITPASSPMSKSYTANCIDNRTFEACADPLNCMVINENANLTRSLNFPKTEAPKVSKVLPLQSLPTDQSPGRSSSVLRSLDTSVIDDKNDIMVTVTDANDVDANISYPSSSSSLDHTPEPTTPVKEIPKHDDGGSPIMRGLKTVLNMFRSSQSPIPPEDDKKEFLSPADVALPDYEDEEDAVLASTPLATEKNKKICKANSPHRESLVFNEDLEKELQWNEDTTIFFPDEKIPIHKLFFQQGKLNTSMQKENVKLDTTVEYMDISYNESLRDKTLTEVLANKTCNITADSDSEFVDCETTFSKNDTADVISTANDISNASSEQKTATEASILNKTVSLNQTEGINSNVTNITQANKESFDEGCSHTSADNEHKITAKPETADANLEQICLNVTKNPTTENSNAKSIALYMEESKALVDEICSLAAANVTSHVEHNNKNKQEAAISKHEQLCPDVVCPAVETTSSVSIKEIKQELEIKNACQSLVIPTPSDMSLTEINTEEKQITATIQNHSLIGIQNELKHDLPIKVPLSGDEFKSVIDDDIHKSQNVDVFTSKNCETTQAEIIQEIFEKPETDEISCDRSKNEGKFNQIHEFSSSNCYAKDKNEAMNQEVIAYVPSVSDIKNIEGNTLAIKETSITQDDIVNSEENFVEAIPAENNVCSTIKEESLDTVQTDCNQKLITSKETIKNNTDISNQSCGLSNPKTFDINDVSEMQTVSTTQEQVNNVSNLNDSPVVEEIKPLNSTLIIKDTCQVNQSIPDANNKAIKSAEMSEITQNNEENYVRQLACNISHDFIKEEINASEKELPVSSPVTASGDTIQTLVVTERQTPETDIINPIATNTVSPPISPKIVSKGYNFNFDEIDDPFATKTKIRQSPPPGGVNNSYGSVDENKVEANFPKRDMKNQRRKSQPAKNKQTKVKSKFNATFESTCQIPVGKESHESEPISAQQIIEEKLHVPNTDQVVSNSSQSITLLLDGGKSPLVSTPTNVDTESYVAQENIENSQNTEQFKSNSATTPVEDGLPIDTKINTESASSDDKIDVSVIQPPTEDFSSLKILSESFSENISEDKLRHLTSSSEQSIYLSAGTSSSECIEPKNKFNLPEIDSIDFNPFATKTKIRCSPDICMEISKPASQEEIQSEEVTQVKLPEEPAVEKIPADMSYTSCSSKTNDKDATVQEFHTDTDDTIEGPFLEADDFEGKMNDFDNHEDDMMRFSYDPSQRIQPMTTSNDDNVDAGELFIDAEAFEFLLNQNQSNAVCDSGKESLFLKFDPLFAKRLSTEGGVADALKKFRTRQRTPKKSSPPSNIMEESVSHAAGPSNINVTYEGEQHTVFDESNDDLNITVSKPMMVVNPAVNPVATPRNKAILETTRFISPAVAAIDRLLSMSANNSLSHDASVSNDRASHETQLALVELREILADKKNNNRTHRDECEKLKDRLSVAETKLRSLEEESKAKLKICNELEAKLTKVTEINNSMASVVEKYERTIATLIADTEQEKKQHAEERMQLIKERDEQTAHLTSMEISFNDLHSKYEKSKQIILTFKSNEEACLKTIKEYEENFDKLYKNYELLKQHATAKLDHANEELEKINRAHQSEVLKLNAMIKRRDVDISSLEETLAQKTKANEELTAICDELINKVG